ncbi:MAG TPA: hypothetical protein VM029_17365 [Opitutaceae bacterium]|nr:hypothetical protein [Opitutaceae bacterium]
MPAPRVSARSSALRPAAAAAERAGALAVLGFVLFLLVRACGYDTGVVLKYAAYFGLHVALPGTVALSAIRRRPVSPLLAIALGVPTGFALEIASFVAWSSLGVKQFIPYLPLAWIAFGVLLRHRRRRPVLACRWTARQAGVTLALALLFLCTVLAAVSQMFAESPLAGGLPQRAIFHDWMYLVSRATALKHAWPPADPSLAGTTLQYHYFMLIHAASASTVAKLEVTLVLLRLMIVPLGAVLVAQAFVLGRLLSRSSWGGVMAALLTVAAGEMSFAGHYGQPTFLGLFVRWLYMSPTFFFGVSFFGALLLAVSIPGRRGGPDGAQLAWLALLAAAGTGAKGTVVPVLLLGLGFWAAWQWIRERRFPRGLTAIALTMGGSFAVVYFTTMSAWGTGEASFEPFRVLQVTDFWKVHAAQLQAALARWMPSSLAGKLAAIACALVVIAGTSGVRLLALAYFLRGNPCHRRPMASWLVAVFLSAGALGLLLHLDSYGELYLILLMRLPMAVLAAAFLIGAGRQLHHGGARRFEAVRPRPIAGIARRMAGGVAAVGIALALAVQSGGWIHRNRAGLTEWLRLPPALRVNDRMLALHEAMLWVRDHTEPNAVLVANAFTPGHLRHGRGILVDQTTAGVHYYYSALSERRLYVEGPTYLLDSARARRRMDRAATIFYGGKVPRTGMPDAAPCYAIIDRSLNDGAKIALPDRHRIFVNSRFEIYRLPRKQLTPISPPHGEMNATLADE